MFQILIIIFSRLYTKLQLWIERITVAYTKTSHWPWVIRKTVIPSHWMHFGRSRKSPAITNITFRTVALNLWSPFAINIYTNIPFTRNNMWAFGVTCNMGSNHLPSSLNSSYRTICSCHIFSRIIWCITKIPGIKCRINRPGNCYFRKSQRNRNTTTIFNYYLRMLPIWHWKIIIKPTVCVISWQQIVGIVKAQRITSQTRQRTRNIGLLMSIPKHMNPYILQVLLINLRKIKF